MHLSPYEGEVVVAVAEVVVVAILVVVDDGVTYVSQSTGHYMGRFRAVFRPNMRLVLGI